MSEKNREILGELWLSDVARTVNRAKKQNRDLSEIEISSMISTASNYGVEAEVQKILSQDDK